MSFSSEIKEELSKLNTFSKKELMEAELIGYCESFNCTKISNQIEFITENEFNIERIYKLLFKLNINYEPETKRKVYIAKFSEKYIKHIEEYKAEEEIKAIVRGLFLGSGSVNNPNKKYHLEILLKEKDIALYIKNILKQAGIETKILESKNTLYIKEGEEISKFLAFIGANKSVLKFEEIRVMKDMRNDINRKVNCETANLNKTVEASVLQIEAINFLKKMKKFEELPENLIEIAETRIENPEASLKELGQLLENPIGKSGVNHRLKKIIEIADELKKGE